MYEIDFISLILSMEDNAARCAYPELKFQIDFYGPLILQGAEADSVQRYNELRYDAQKGIDYEEIHGRWALLKLDHPITIKLKNRGYYQETDCARH